MEELLHKLLNNATLWILKKISETSLKHLKQEPSCTSQASVKAVGNSCTFTNVNLPSKVFTSFFYPIFCQIYFQQLKTVKQKIKSINNI